MTAPEIARLLAASVCVVTFVKKDGTTRRMMTAPGPEGVTMKGGMVTVWDCEKGDWRRVNTATVTSIRALAATAPNRAPVQHARPQAPRPAALDAATVRAWEDDFDTGFRSFAR